MPTTDSIVRPSLLLKKTLVAGQKANVDSVAKAGQNTDSPVLLRPKKQKRFQLTDFKFAEEGYFKGNKYFKLGRGDVHADGVSGILAPYAVSNDNVIAAMLLGCFIMAMVAFSLSRNFIERQVKSFFRGSRSKESVVEANEEIRFQPILIAQTSLLGSILYYFFVRDVGGGRLSNDSQLGAIGCFLASSSYISYSSIWSMGSLTGCSSIGKIMDNGGIHKSSYTLLKGSCYSLLYSCRFISRCHSMLH